MFQEQINLEKFNIPELRTIPRNLDITGLDCTLPRLYSYKEISSAYKIGLDNFFLNEK